jgi:hypothetical protein
MALYTLTVDSEPINVNFSIKDGWPKVYTTPYSGTFEEGTTFTIVMPTDFADLTTGYGYAFDYMEYNGATTTDPFLDIVMDKDKKVTAHFKLVQTEAKKLTIRSQPISVPADVHNGFVYVTMGNTPVEVLYPKDFNTGVCVPDQTNNSRFDHYTIDTATSKNNPISFNVDKDYTLTAYYTAPTANISGTVTESLLFGLIKHPSTGAKVSIDTVKATTTANGTYSLTDIPLGTYTVTVTKPYYETKTAQISLTEAGKTYTLDFEIPLSKWINFAAIGAAATPLIAIVAFLARRRKQ